MWVWFGEGVSSPAHSGLSSSKFTAKSCETFRQGRKDRSFLLAQQATRTQHDCIQSNLQVDRCILLSCWSKASWASKKDLKSKYKFSKPRPLLSHTRILSFQMSYLEVRGYQSSKSKSREHFITGEKETDIFHIKKGKKEGENNGQKLCNSFWRIPFMQTFVKGFDSQRGKSRACVYVCVCVFGRVRLCQH